MVNSFQYLSQVIIPEDNDCSAVFRNFSWTRVMWKRITRNLSREGEEPQLYIFFLKSVV